MTGKEYSHRRCFLRTSNLETCQMKTGYWTAGGSQLSGYSDAGRTTEKPMPGDLGKWRPWSGLRVTFVPARQTDSDQDSDRALVIRQVGRGGCVDRGRGPGASSGRRSRRGGCGRRESSLGGSRRAGGRAAQLSTDAAVSPLCTEGHCRADRLFRLPVCPRDTLHRSFSLFWSGV